MCHAFKIREIQNGLRWFGHIQRREEDHIVKAVQGIKVQGQRKNGRPEMRWRDVINKDLKELNLRPEDALDRKLWRERTHTADPKDLGQTQRI